MFTQLFYFQYPMSHPNVANCTVLQSWTWKALGVSNGVHTALHTRVERSVSWLFDCPLPFLSQPQPAPVLSCSLFQTTTVPYSFHAYPLMYLGALPPPLLPLFSLPPSIHPPSFPPSSPPSPHPSIHHPFILFNIFYIIQKDWFPIFDVTVLISY